MHFPRLAGMNADYLRKQFEDFTAGHRENAVMKPIASALSPGDRKAMADYSVAIWALTRLLPCSPTIHLPMQSAGCSFIVTDLVQRQTQIADSVAIRRR